MLRTSEESSKIIFDDTKRTFRYCILNSFKRKDPNSIQSAKIVDDEVEIIAKDISLISEKN